MPGSKNRFEYEVAIVGGGSAGYAAARTIANAGLSTVVIEGGEQVGGLCILRGCMPSKALLYAAELVHLARQAAVWGIQVKELRFDFRKVMARKNALIEQFAEDRRRQLVDGPFKFIRARAQFIGPHTLALDNGQKLTARYFIISTGSVVAPSPLLYLAEVGYLDSDSALKLSKLPRTVIVLGGGAVATEFAQFFARFGVKVTLVQRSPHVLHEMDSDAAGELENVFRREGVELFTNTRLIGARRHVPATARRGNQGNKSVTFYWQGREVEIAAEEIFFALGRVPNTASLGLEKATVATERGRIITNARMQTSASHIYAAGDCTSPCEIVHIAVQQGEIAAHNITHPKRPRKMDYRLLTEVVFTDPQIAVVGLTEKQAITRDIPYLAASYPFNDHGKSLIMAATNGFVKLLANPDSGEILGGCCVGPQGGELIHEIIAAMSKRMTVHQLAALPHYHPTLAEIWTYPAEELASRIRPSSGSSGKNAKNVNRQVQRHEPY